MTRFATTSPGGAFLEPTEEEIGSCGGPVNCVVHCKFYKPGSVPTKGQLVANSCLDNYNKGLSIIDCFPKSPNSLVPDRG